MFPRETGWEPQNTASIPSFAEPIPESDPKFSLVPFPPSRRMSPTATESLAFSPPNGNGFFTGVTAHTEGDMEFPGDDRTFCRGSVRVPKGGERGRDIGSLGGKGECVARDDV
jgi:hypothetical protein